MVRQRDKVLGKCFICDKELRPVTELTRVTTLRAGYPSVGNLPIDKIVENQSESL
jgi:hypothetical protein